MSALWLILAGASIFMLFYTYSELADISAMFLSAGWFGVFFLCIFESIAIFRDRRRKPSRKEQQEAYYHRMRQLSARSTRRA